MIQTAEGALNEIHSILQRMRELAVQAGNDTNTNEDRCQIQQEINQLTSEINRIGNTTEFNNQKLLQGGDGTTLDGIGVDLADKTTTISGTDAKVQNAKATIDITVAVSDGNKIEVELNGRKLEVEFATGGTAGDTVYTEGKATISIGTYDDKTNSEAMAKALQTLIDKDETLKGNYKVTSGGTGAMTIEAVNGSGFFGSKGNIKVSTTGATTTVQANTGANGAMAALATGGICCGKRYRSYCF